MRKQYEISKETRSYVLVDNKAYENKVLDVLEVETFVDNPKRFIGLDIETTPAKGYENVGAGGLDPHRTDIATIQVSPLVGTTDFIFHVKKYGISPRLKKYLLSTVPVCHNAVFEYMHLKKVGIEFDDIHDSMLLFRLVIQAKKANFKSFKADLANLYLYVYGEPLSKECQLSNWGADELTPEQLEYAARDCYATLRCFGHLLQEANKFFPSILNFYRINRLALPAIGDQVYYGVRLDEEVHDKMIAEWKKESKEAHIDLMKVLPTTVNTASPKQMSEWLTNELEKTEEGIDELANWPVSEKTGLLKVDAKTLRKYAYLPVVGPLLRYKKTEKRLSTYGENLKKFINPVTGNTHPQYTQCFTGSGRLSSHSYNIQNGPRGDFRKVFIPDDGYVLIGADYGAIEVRVFAHHSQDPVMLEAFERGIDIYSIVAALITGKKLAEIGKGEDRQKAKAILLGRLFLLGPNTLVSYAKDNYNVDMTVAQAKDFIQLIDDTFPVGASWQQRTVREVKKSLKSVSKMGKIRVLAHDNYYNKSVNNPVQSDAAAIVCIAQANIRTAFKKNRVDGHIYVNVHDEIITSVREEQQELGKKLQKECMEQAMLSVFPDATLVKLVDVRSGYSWAETK